MYHTRRQIRLASAPGPSGTTANPFGCKHVRVHITEAVVRSVSAPDRALIVLTLVQHKLECALPLLRDTKHVRGVRVLLLEVCRRYRSEVVSNPCMSKIVLGIMRSE